MKKFVLALVAAVVTSTVALADPRPLPAQVAPGPTAVEIDGNKCLMSTAWDIRADCHIYGKVATPKCNHPLWAWIGDTNRKKLVCADGFVAADK